MSTVKDNNIAISITKPPPIKIPPINMAEIPSQPQSFTLKISAPSSAESSAHNMNADKLLTPKPIIPPKSASVSNHIPFPSPDPTKRVRGIVCKKPIIYGNVTHRLEGKPDFSAIIQPASNANTNGGRRASQSSAVSFEQEEWYRWTVYVRGVDNEDLSYLIKKVVFVLHETYVNPVRIVEKAPFEVTESGWGQFEVKIEIYFHSHPGLTDTVSPSRELSGSQPPQKRQKLAASQSAKQLTSSFYNYINGKLSNPSPLKDGAANRKRKFHEIMHEEDENKRSVFGDEGMQASKHTNIWSLRDEELSRLYQEKQTEIMKMFHESDDLPKDAETDSSSASSSTHGYENKVVFLHALRLFAEPDRGEDHNVKGIVEEKYVVIEFYDPYYYLYEKLWLGPHRVCAPNHPFYETYWRQNVIKMAEQEQQLIKKIAKCHKQLLQKIDQSNQEYKQLLSAKKKT